MLGMVLLCVVVLDGAGSGIDVIHGSKERMLVVLHDREYSPLHLTIRPIPVLVHILVVIVVDHPRPHLRPHLRPRSCGPTSSSSTWTTLGVVVVPAIIDDRGAGISPGHR